MTSSSGGNPVATDLHDCTTRLRALVDSLFSTTASAGVPSRVISSEEMSAVLAELMRAGQALQRLPQKRNSQLESELRHYRSQVERLRILLPMIQAALLAERARLECDRERVNATAEWLRASRQTL